MSALYDFDLVCIGSGPAGQRGAVAAAKLGRRVAVAESRRIGGVAVDTGTIPSKTFREAAIHFSRLAGRFDRPNGGQHPVQPSAKELLQQVSAVVQREADIMAQQLYRNGVELLWGEASFTDPHTLRIRSENGSERRVTTANVLIAVGTRPTSPPGVAPDGDRVITSDMIMDLTRLPRTMAVVGAGVIGIEYASMFAALGVEVTLVDRRERPLEFVDREIVDELVHQMRKREVSFRLGEAVEKVELAPGSERRVVLMLESGKRIVTDLLLFSVGRSGATENLNLSAAGIEADSRGRIVVDACFRTNVPHVYAAGDVIGYPALASTSSEQGRRAACHACDAGADIMQPQFPIGIYSIPEISTVGKTEEELTRDKVPYEVGIARYREIARGQILGDDSGLLKMLFHRGDRRLLGVHIIGTGATELLHIGQAVLVHGGGLDYFLQTVFNYPTLAECYKVAAFDASNKFNC